MTIKTAPQRFRNKKSAGYLLNGRHFYKGFIIWKTVKYGCNYFCIYGEHRYYNDEMKYGELVRYLTFKEVKAHIDRLEQTGEIEPWETYQQK